MAHFTVKLYDAHGRMVGRREFSAADDREAEIAVGQLGEERTLELWCAGRWIRTWAGREGRRKA